MKTLFLQPCAWAALCGLAAAAAQAGTIADPTRPPASWGAAPAASATAPARAASAAVPHVLRVQSVQLPREGRASALVDNRLVFVGDRLGGATVVAIDAQGIELKRTEGRSERLRLIDAAIVKQAALAAPTPSTAPAAPVASVAAAGGKQP